LDKTKILKGRKKNRYRNSPRKKSIRIWLLRVRNKIIWC